MPTRAQIAEAWAVVQRERARLVGRLEIVWVLPDYYEQFPKPCMGGWARAYMTVTPAGEAWPCHAAGCITTLQFDNVRAHALEWIWNESDAFTRFRGDAWMPEPCRSCARKSVDFGGCRCQAFLVAGDAGVTDPVCSLSPNRGRVDAAVDQAATAGDVDWVYRTNPASRAGA
jgi:pyrroloquinoline quinone biosynthesis protein E